MPEPMPSWFAEHEAADRKSFADRPTKEEMRAIVDEALIDFFTTKGRLSKNILVTVAVIIGALAVIGGGAKWILAILGFGIIKN